MSKRRKNNHYHYAEKFEDRSSRSASVRRAYMPFKSVIISLVVLLLFGLIGTTFSVYVTENDPADDPNTPSILMQVRNTKAAHDIAVTGADVDLAGTGWTWMTMTGGGYFIFDNTNTNWNDVQIFVGRDNNYGSHGRYCAVYNMSQITNTNFYYCQISGWDTSGDGTHIEQIIFVTGASNWGSNNENPDSRANYATARTAAFSSSFSFSSTGVYACEPASSGNPRSVSITGTATSGDHAGYNYFNYYQNIRSNSCDDGSTYYENNNGGTIGFSAIRLTANNAAGTSEDETGKFRAVLHSTVTLTANTNSGYRFVGWYNSSGTQLSDGVGGYTIGTNSSGKPYISYTCTGTNEIHAYFIKTCTVTVQNMSGYSGTQPTGSGTYDVGQSVTISATTPQGVSFTGWTISGTYSGGNTSSTSTTITPSSDITATASYSLAAPTNLVLTYDAYKIVGYTDTYGPISPSPSAQTQTASGSGSAITFTYSIAKHSSNTEAGSNTYQVSSAGAVSATVPGKYVVTMTATDTCFGLSSSATTTATVEVKPETPAFTSTVQGYTGGVVEGTTGTSPSTPYKIPINSGSAFQITSGLPGITGYTYNWTMTDGSSTATYTGIQKIDKASDTGTVMHDRPAGDYSYGISLKATYNGVESLPATSTIYYAVTADFLNTKHFNFDNTFDDSDTPADESKTVQKIYAVDNSISQIYAAFNAGGTDFDTILYFSKNNKNFTPIQIFTDLAFTLNGKTYDAQPNDAAHQTVRPYTVDSTTNYLIFNLPVVAQLANNGTAINETVNVMQRSGVKYFKAYVDDFRNNRVSAAEPDLHTTVGTSSAAGARPIYFKDSSYTYSNTRLMAFFVNANGEMTYQTAENYNGVVTGIDSSRTDRTGIYRFYAPSDAVYVCFAYTTTTGYVLPTIDTTNGVSIGFGTDNTIFPAYTSVVNLDNDHNMYKITSRTADGNGIYDCTGVWTNLDMDS